jgi:hypothetical protein
MAQHRIKALENKVRVLERLLKKESDESDTPSISTTSSRSFVAPESPRYSIGRPVGEYVSLLARTLNPDLNPTLEEGGPVKGGAQYIQYPSRSRDPMIGTEEKKRK